MTRVATVGAAIQDVFLSNSEAFAPVCINPDTCFEMLELGSKADVNTIHFSTGGGATNAAVTFARQGLDVRFMGVIGHDTAGQAVLDDLDREHVDTSMVRYSDKYHTGYSVLLVAPDGQRTILTYRGASTHYEMSHFDMDSLADTDWLYVTTLSGSMDVLSQLFERAKQSGVKIFFNPGKKELAEREKLIGLLEDVDVLLVNKKEAMQLVHGSTLEELARHSLNIVPTALITDGANGVVATDGEVLLRAGLYEDVPMIDQTGAGDSFGSGFLSQWCEGKSLRESIIFASANSTAVIGQMGAKAGILYKDTELHEMPIWETELV